MRYFELFFLDEKISAADWRQLEKKIEEHDRNSMFELVFAAGTIEFYLHSRKDLSPLSLGFKNIILIPAKNRDSMAEFKHFYPAGLKRFVGILEFKEKNQIKTGQELKRLTITHLGKGPFKFYQTKLFMQTESASSYYLAYTPTNPLFTFEYDFSKKAGLKKKSPPSLLKIDKAVNLFTPLENTGFLQVDGFPYFVNPIYFPLKNFELNKHSLIVGQTGVGKSKLIELLVKEIERWRLTDEYRIVIIDPQAVLYPEFLTLKSSVNIDFIKSACDLFPSFSEPKIATELTILLFKTLMKEQFNAKMERTLKYSIFALFLKEQMSLLNLKKFLTELEFRKQICASLADNYDYLVHFFETEYTDLLTKYYEIAIMPVLVLIDELSFIPALGKETQNDLEEILKNNFLTCFSLSRIFLGEKATRLIAGLIIQQIFLIAQKKSLNQKLILIIDELPIVENDGLVSILSEARKFNLSLFFSQQYLTQISPQLLKSALSNIYNYFVFKVSDEDAKIFAHNLQMEFPEEILKTAKSKGLNEEDLRRNLLVNLNPQECLVRIFFQSKFYPCFKAKTKLV